MKTIPVPGNLVQKVSGYGCEENWTGIVLEVSVVPVATDKDGTSPMISRCVVLTKDGIESWVTNTLLVISE